MYICICYVDIYVYIYIHMYVCICTHIILLTTYGCEYWLSALPENTHMNESYHACERVMSHTHSDPTVHESGSIMSHM